MKKGLLSILAGALLVVGCQNYDDQFDGLETQINALASTVAGLSQVQSQLTELAGTVSSLSSTVTGLGSTIDTAVADGLADIQADIDAITSAVADVASSEEVSALSDAVAASQEDLDQLLANSSVYQNSILINSVATLDVYYSMGSAINIVNGSVTITVSEDMDMEKVQAVVDNILVTLNDFTYTSGASTIAEVTFLNLTGTSSLTVEQAGGYDFRNLQSATNIVLGDAYKSTIGVIHFGALASVTSFATEGTPNTISFSKATELHLTSLPFYAPGTLTLLVDTGSVIDISALDDVDSSGDQDDLSLTISGPKTLTLSNIDDGDISISDIATAVVNGFVGNITVGADVESFTADSVVESLTITGATDLETLNITGVLDADDDDSVGIAIAITSANSDLESLTVAGDVASLTVTAASKLSTAVVSADVDGAITFTNNDDLETLTLTGSEADSVAITGNDSLVSLTVDTTNTEDDGSLVITNNLDLVSLTVTYDEVETLTITGNSALTTVDLSGITDVGAAGAPVVNIYSNDLTATSSVDEEDTTATADGAASTDLGSFTTTSGLDTAATYLALVAADADSSAAVFFDTVESYTNESEFESTDVVFATSLLTAAATAQNATTVLLKVANTADTGSDAIAAKRTVIIDPAENETFGVYANGVTILADVALTNVTNLNAVVNQIVTTDALTQADVAGVTLSATPYAKPEVSITFSTNDAADENSMTVVNATSINGDVFNSTASDVITVAIDGYSASASEGNTVLSIMHTLYNDWYADYSNANAVDWLLVSNGTNKLTFRSKDSGTSNIGVALTATVSIASTALSNIGYLIGNLQNTTKLTTDNIAQGTYVAVTLTADTGGSLLGEIGKTGDAEGTGVKAAKFSGTAAGKVSLTTSVTDPNSDTASAVITATQRYVHDSRSDVVMPTETVAAASSNGVSYSRVSWL